MKIIDIDEMPKYLNKIKKKYNIYFVFPMMNVFVDMDWKMKKKIGGDIGDKAWNSVKDDITKCLLKDGDITIDDKILMFNYCFKNLKWNKRDFLSFEGKKRTLAKEHETLENTKEYIERMLSIKMDMVVQESVKFINNKELNLLDGQEDLLVEQIKTTNGLFEIDSLSKPDKLISDTKNNQYKYKQK